MKQRLKILHLLSLDVALAAVAGALFFNAASSLSVYATLGISTWIWYLVDRLIDAHQYADLHTQRHDFHRTHSRPIIILVAILVLCNIVSLFFLPKNILENGLIISGLMLVYGFSLIKFPQKIAPFKEVIVAIIYAAGVSIDSSIDHFWTVCYGLVVWQSLMVFSFYETLENPTVRNAALMLGSRWLKIQNQLLVFGFVLLFSINQGLHTGLLLGMTLCNFTLFIFHKKLIINNLYRILGELVFILPVLCFKL